MPVRNSIAERLETHTEWRRDFHAHPELMFDTHRTAAKVAEHLRAFGCDEVAEGVGGSGVVGLIRGRGAGRSIALRADMDALPILEATGVPYASTTPGKMHACGHDGHTTMLLGAAEYLAATRNFTGTVVLIFQPAEEGGGGAKVMMEDGLFERFPAEEIYGLHNVPGMPEGTFAARVGAFYPCTDEIEIEITGRGGHAAQPHQTVDSTVIAAHVILGLQSLVSRVTDPVKEAVVSVTTLETDSTAFNVIAGRVKMRGTVRAFEPDLRSELAEKAARIVEMTAAAHGAKGKLTYQKGYPSLINTAQETAHAEAAARTITGDCAEAPKIMWGEDFSFYLEELPGSFLSLGVGDTAPLHHPEYNFNDAVIPVGASWFVELVESRNPA